MSTALFLAIEIPLGVAVIVGWVWYIRLALGHIS